MAFTIRAARPAPSLAAESQTWEPDRSISLRNGNRARRWLQRALVVVQQDEAGEVRNAPLSPTVRDPIAGYAWCVPA
jgi:hypothetical protein